MASILKSIAATLNKNKRVKTAFLFFGTRQISPEYYQNAAVSFLYSTRQIGPTDDIVTYGRRLSDDDIIRRKIFYQPTSSRFKAVEPHSPPGYKQHQEITPSGVASMLKRPKATGESHGVVREYNQASGLACDDGGNNHL